MEDTAGVATTISSDLVVDKDSVDQEVAAAATTAGRMDTWPVNVPQPPKDVHATVAIKWATSLVTAQSPLCKVFAGKSTRGTGGAGGGEKSS